MDVCLPGAFGRMRRVTARVAGFVNMMMLVVAAACLPAGIHTVPVSVRACDRRVGAAAGHMRTYVCVCARSWCVHIACAIVSPCI